MNDIVTLVSEYKYEVDCPFCGEEYAVTMHPDYCAMCGTKLESE